MNAPETEVIQLITRAYLFPSPTNPRKRKGLDAESLKELAQTMRPPIGILEPLIVREIVIVVEGAEVVRWEIIAGERRWRAAEIAGLVKVPCIVRTFTDQQTLQAQLIENKKREDLDALEEAEGYEKLMQEKDADGNNYTAEMIADLMAVSRSTIYGRLTLLKLCQEVRQAFYDGKIDASKALDIARIVPHKLQIKALEKITQSVGYPPEPMSYRAAHALIQSEFMTDLGRAVFNLKDADLLPKAGSCTDCPNRTGNQPELFSDEKNTNVCTDQVCFGMKKAAHMLAIQKKAEEQGNEVILGNKAKKIIPNNWNPVEYQLRDHGYETLDSEVPGDEKGRTYGQVLKEHKLLTPAKDTGKPAVQKTIIENPNKPGQMIETINIEAATKALREAGFEITPVHQAKANSNDANRKEREKIDREIAQANAYRQRLFDTLHKKIDANLNNPKPVLQDGLYGILAEYQFADMIEYGMDEEADRLARIHLPDLHDDADGAHALLEHIPKMTTQQHFLLLIDMLLVNEMRARHHERNEHPERMSAVAKEIGIDVAAIKKEAVDEVKAAQKAAAAAAKKAEAEKAAKKAAKGAAKPAAAAEQKQTTPAVLKAHQVASWPFPESGKVAS